ncbi:PKD domain-containing protein [Flaviaesturariibacter flavus]|uniref:PKD domain-containing protein n=1 Tax=Flaviaesturariibacter flavus TaxID=2502780 RepID=A0A4R1B984_9BACT|nr:PKD-like domain-containing protein [Flaviaesturariibacter flavus]TCJ13299.1 PKD domain-containing protein [Flaviaesturariibacter flavus]
MELLDGSPAPSSAYQFTNSTTNSSQHPQITFTQQGTYYIKLTSDNGTCAAESIRKEVIVLAATGLTIPGQQRYCGVPTIIDFGSNNNHKPNYNNGLAAVGESYLWTVTGGTYNFVGTTSSGSRYPKIEFTQYGTYTVSLQYINSCGTKNVSQTIIFDQPVTSNAGADTTVCYNVTSITLSASSTGPAGITSAWTSSGSGSFSPNNAPGTTYTFSSSDRNVNGNNITLTYTVTPPAGSACLPASDSRVVTIRPENHISSANNKTICGGNSVAYTPTASQTGSTFTWTSVVSGTVTGNNASGSGPINDVLNNSGPNSGTVTYTIIPVKDGCDGTAFSFTVTVKPTPVIATAVKTDPTTCGGSDGKITLTGLIAGQYTVTFTKSGSGNQGPLTISANTLGELVIPNLTQGTYSNFVVTFNSCASPAFAGPVTLSDPPLPAAPAVGSNSPICSGATLNLTASSVTPGVDYTWTGPGISGNSTQQNPSIANAPTSATGTYTVVVNKANCKVQATVTVTVDPTPVANSVPDATFCNGTATSAIALAGTPATGTVYSWTNSNTAIGLGATGNGNIPSFNAVNAGNTAATATVTITPKFTNGANSCTGTDKTFTITINPTPAADAVTGQVLCAGSPVAAINFSGTATSYSWTNSNTSIGLGASGNGNIPSFNAVNGGTSVQTATITVTPRYTGGSVGCDGPTKTFTIVVVPNPTVNNVSAQTVCDGASTSAVNFSGSVSGTVYNWTNNNPAIGLAASGTGNIPAFTATNGGTTAVTATITVTPSFTSNGITCTGAPKTFTITVNPTPSVNNSTAQTLCAGTATTAVGFSGTAGATFDWTNSNTAIGLAASGSGNIATFTAANATNVPLAATITVIPRIGNCAGPVKTFTITVNPRPVITNLAQAMCSNNTFNGTPVHGVPASTVVPAGTTYTWGTPVSSPGGAITGGSAQSTPVTTIGQTLINTTTASATLTYTITPVSGADGNCPGDPFTVTVTVNPQPGISDRNVTACSGTANNLTPTGVPASTSYSWGLPVITPSGALAGATAGSGASAINQTLTNSTNAPATAVYTVTPTAGTCGNGTFTITLTVNPKPAIASYTPADICSGDAFTVTPTQGTPAGNVVPAGTTYSWTVSAPSGVGGAVAGNSATGAISQTLTNSTTTLQTVVYTVTPTSGTCAGGTFTITVRVAPRPVVANASATICSGAAFDATPSGVPTGTTYTWSAPVIAPSGAITGAAAQASAVSTVGQTLTNTTNSAATATYTVTPKSGACEGQPFTVTVTVQPKAVIANYTDAICSGASFTITPADGQPTAATVIPAGTTYTWGVPASNPAGAISGGAAQASGVSTIGAALTNGTNTPAALTYTVTPKSGSCNGAMFTVAVTVNPKPVIPAQSAITCSDATFTVSPVNGAAGTIVPGGTTYSWSVPTVTGGMTGGTAGNGQTSISGTLNNPTNVAQTATYTVTPVSGAAGSCPGAPFTVTVTVNPQPGISSQTASICSGGTFTVNPAGAPANTQYTWGAPVSTPAGAVTGGSAQSSQGSISQTLTNTTNTPATLTYSVTPTAGSCGNSAFSVTVSVNPKPKMPALAADICGGDAFSISPVDNPPGTIVPANTKYSWTAPAIVPASAITGGSAQNNMASIGQTLSNTTNASATATYTVTPTSGDAGSCVGNAFQVTVTVRPRPAVANKTAAICSGGTFSETPANSGADIVPAGTTYSWSTPVVTGGITGGAAGTAQTSITGTLINPTSAVQTATYTVTPKSGTCEGSPFTVTVTVKPTPVVTAQTATICSGAAFGITLADNPPATVLPSGTTFSWTAPAINPALAITGASAQTAQTAIGQALTNVTNAPATATYTVTPSYDGCTGSPFTVTVTVNPKPVIGNQTMITCSNTGFSFTPANAQPTTIVPGGTTYSWSAPVVTGVMTGGAAGTAQASITGTLINPTNVAQTATYTVSPVSGAAGNCPGADFQLVVTVNPQPGISAQAATICSGAPFAVSPAGAPANTTYTWGTPVSNPVGAITGGSAQSNQNTIGQTLTNNTNTPATLTYSVTPTAGSCGNNAFAVTVTVNPKPVVTGTVADICSGETFAATPANGAPAGTIIPANTTYMWGVPVSNPSGAITGGTAQMAQATISGTLVNTTNAVATLTYTVTPTSGDAGNCVGASFTTVVSVRPRPAIANKTDNICSGGTFTVSPANAGADIVPAGTTYSWSVPVVTGGITGGAAGSGQTNISGTLNNPTSGPQTATYTVTPKSGACEGAPFTITVTVNPTPVLPAQVAEICSGATFNVAPADNPPAAIVPTGTTYSWPVPASNPAGAVTGGSAQSGQAAVSQALTNTTNAVATLTYTVTPAVSGCAGQAFAVTVTVNPKPVIGPKDLEICSGQNFSYTPANNAPATIVPTGTTYSWSAPVITGGLTGGAPGTAQTTIGGNLVNPTNVPQTATYTVIPTSGAAGNCVGAAFTVTVTVNPQPGITDQVATICSGTAFTVSPAGAPANTVYTWTVPVSNPAGVVTGGSAQATPQPNISQPLTNTSNVPASIVYTVTPTAGSCGNIAFNVTLTVNPTPVVSGTVAEICSGDAFAATPVNGTPAGTIIPANTSYSWSTPVSNPAGAITGGAAASSQAAIAGTLTNTTNASATLTYTVTPVSGDAGSCAGASFPAVITVRPRPRLADKTLTVCSGAPFTVTPANAPPGDIVPANITYSWSAPAVTGGITGGTSGTAQASISGTLLNPTSTVQTATYTITPKAGDCEGPAFTLTVTVNPTPLVPAQVAEICSGSTFAVNPADNPPGVVVPAGTTYSWPAPVSNPAGAIAGGSAQSGQGGISQVLTNTTNAVATLIYTVTPSIGNCSGTPFTVTVTVNPRPLIGPMSDIVCSGASFNAAPVNAAPGTIVPANTTFSWGAPTSNPAGALTGGSAQSGQPFISQTLINNTIAVATATYTVTPTSGAAGGCVGAPFTVTVTVKPQPSIPDQQATICSGGNFSITPANAPVGTVYTWALPTSNPAGAVTGGAAGNSQPGISGTLTNVTNAPAVLLYTVTPVASDCSNSTFTVAVTVNPKPVIGNMAAVTCSDVAFDIAPANNQPTTIVPVNTTYTWTAPVSSPAGALTGGLAQVAPQPSISQLLANTTAAPATMTYTVTPVSGDAGNCPGAPFTAVVTVNPDARAVFVPTDTIECPPFVITPAVVGLQTFPQANSTYSWYANGVLIGNGTTFPGYTIANENDSIDIKLVAGSQYGCKADSMVFRFFSHKLPHPDFTLAPPNGCGPLSVNITNTTPYTDFFQYQWNFGQGQSSTNVQPGVVVFPPNPTYGDTTYIVTLKAWNECDTVTITKNVQVASRPKALFTPDRTVGCSPMRVNFSNTSLGIGVTYTWIWDDGTSQNSPTRDMVTHTFNTSVQDTFYVKLVAHNQCGDDTATYAIVVSPNPIQLFMAVNGTEANGCAPHTVNFINNTIGATGFQWDFGDGNTLSTTRGIDTVTHTYLAAGTYTVQLKAFNGCTDTTMFLTINVFPKPDASFVASRYTACLGDTIQFTNTSQGATSYLWKFGDGDVTTLVIPAHAWSTPGVYNVTLVAYRINGPGNVCPDSVKVPVQIVASVPGGITVSDSLTNCVPFTVTFSNPNQPASVVTWDFGDGFTGTGNVVTHTYQRAGTFLAQLTSLAPGGCTYTAQRTIRVNAPAGTLQYTGGYVCGPRAVRFDATVSGTDTLIWNFGNGVTQSTLSPFVYYQYPNPGLYVPSVTLASASGCRVPVTGVDTIKVDRLVTGFTAAQNRLCGSTPVTFSDTSHVFFGVREVRWDFGDNTSGVGSVVQHTYTSPGQYNIRQVVISNSGCSDTVYKVVDVVVFGIPTAAISADPLGCTRIATTLTANVQSADPISIYEWTVNGTIQSRVNPFVTTFTAGGTYNIRLIVGTVNGCFDTAFHTITVRPSPIVTATNSNDLCLGQSQQLNASGIGVVDWQWSPVDGLSCTTCPNPLATPRATTTYVVTGTNGFGCPGYDTVLLSVHGPISMVVSPSDSICIGDTLLLLASGATSYQWTPNQDISNTSVPNPSVWPRVSTTYRVVGFDGFNCFTDTAFVTVGVGQYPTVNLGPDLVLATGTRQLLTPVVTNGPIRTWSWSPAANLSCANCPQPVAEIRNDVLYTVTVTTAYGCSDTDTMQIKAFCRDVQVFLPNAFSPDGDGVNDVFMVQASGIATVKTFRIFNRWGELVFEKNAVQPNDPRFGWDGRVGGVAAAPDVFVYTVEVLCENGTPYTYKGNVTILK